MKFHEVADIFPMMSSEEYESLKQDIKQNGLLQPIWIYDGQIIDGRNRHNACEDLGISPTFKTWDGHGSLVAFVVSLNLQRRHLDSGQKAFVALEVERLLAEEAKERQREAQVEAGKNFGRGMNNNDRYNQNFDFTYSDEPIDREPGDDDELEETPHKPVVPIVQPKPVVKTPQASEQAAKIVGSNRQYVQDAKFIQEKAPDVAEAVKSGTIKIYEAKKVAALPEEQRRAVIEKVQSGDKPSHAIHEAKQQDKVSKTTWTDSELKRKELFEVKLINLKIDRTFYLVYHKNKYHTKLFSLFKAFVHTKIKPI